MCYITYMNSAGNNSSQTNRGIDNQFTNSLQNGDNFPAQCDILITVEAIKPRHNRIGPILMTTFTANSSVYLVSNSQEDGFTAFSSAAGALAFVADSHGDLNAEGSALMLDTVSGLVPATHKEVLGRAIFQRNVRFVASNADNAAKVAKIQSKLKGALQACALVGVDPSSVAKVGELREELRTMQASLVSDADCATFNIEVVPVHKRKNNKRS